MNANKTTMYIAWNRLTGMFWDGCGFVGTLGCAKYLNGVELAALRYTYLNVEHSIQS